MQGSALRCKFVHEPHSVMLVALACAIGRSDCGRQIEYAVRHPQIRKTMNIRSPIIAGSIPALCCPSVCPTNRRPSLYHRWRHYRDPRTSPSTVGKRRAGIFPALSKRGSVPMRSRCCQQAGELHVAVTERRSRAPAGPGRVSGPERARCHGSTGPASAGGRLAACSDGER